MAIATIAKSFTNKASKLRIPFRKPKTVIPPPPPETLKSEPKPTKEDEFRQVFRILDANNDGMISVDELRGYFESIGEPVSDKEAEQMIKEFSSADGTLLDFGGFVRIVELENHDVDKVLRDAFEVYETERGSGCITPEGLRQVLRRLGEVKSYQECEAMIRVFDLDGNGVLDFHEFHKMMMT